MANPDPKALQAAAATMRNQAQEARKAFVVAEARREQEVLSAQEEAFAQRHAAEQAVKDHQAFVDSYTSTKTQTQQDLDENAKKIAAAEQQGDAAEVEELRERRARVQARLDGIEERLTESQRNLEQSKVKVAEATRDHAEVRRQFNTTSDANNAAEKEIDDLEDKAKLLNEAGLKLDLARTIDNPVERADMELAAEKLLQQASAIQVDAAGITAVTGQELTIPDVSALPAASEATDADGSATGASTDSGGGIQDPFAADAGEGDAAAAASDDVLGADAADVAPAAAVATAAAPDAAVAADPPAATAFETSFDPAAADPLPAVDAASPALADTGTDFAAPALDDPTPIDDGSGAEI